MKTLIEIYDDEPVYNVLAAKIYRPEQVIFVGNRQMMSKSAKNKIIRFFRAAGIDTYAYFYPVTPYDCEDILATLVKIGRRFPESVIDITGGSSVVLYAVGRYCVQFPSTVIAFQKKEERFCCISGVLPETAAFGPIHFNSRDVLAMAGGALSGFGHISAANIDAEMLRDIDAVWSIFCKNKHFWSSHVYYLQCTGTQEEPRDPLRIVAPLLYRENGKRANCDMKIMSELKQAEVLQSLTVVGDQIEFTYKNHLIKHCLSDAGIWLELHLYQTIYESGAFDDVQVSVLVDWDGIEDRKLNTINEIDIMATKGLVPIFISCKIGVPNTVALNEISTLVKTFGGVYAKGCIATACRLSEKSPATYQRAKDMGINVLEDRDLQPERLLKKLLKMAEHP